MTRQAQAAYLAELVKAARTAGQRKRLACLDCGTYGGTHREGAPNAFCPCACHWPEIERLAELEKGNNRD